MTKSTAYKCVHVDVIFRVFPEGDVIAFFPKELNGGLFCDSYQHVGQHGDASLELIEGLRPATKAEYKALKRELESIGYVLNIKENNNE